MADNETAAAKTLAEILDEERETAKATVEELKKEYEERESGLLRHPTGYFPRMLPFYIRHL